MNIIKYIILASAVVGLLSGCSANLAEQIEGVKWQADGGKKLQFLRFVGGEMQHCSMDTLSQWKKAVSYKIGDKKLTMIGKTPDQSIDIDITIEGKGNGRILTLNYPKKGPQIFAISTVQEVCPI